MDLLTPEFGLFFWTLLAFLVVFFILGKFAWKPILNSLGEREKGIADSISTAERVRAEMGLLKSENEKLLLLQFENHQEKWCIKGYPTVQMYSVWPSIYWRHPYRPCSNLARIYGRETNI